MRDGPTGDAEHLEALAGALTAAGWSAVRYGDAPPMLRVTRPSMPVVGETVTVTSEPSGPWFRASTGDLVAPCTELRRAVAYVDATLGWLVPVGP